MKKGLILSSLFVFILVSTAGEDSLFHVSTGNYGSVLSSSESSSTQEGENLPLLCEETEEMEGRSRILPVLMTRNQSDFTSPVIRLLSTAACRTSTHESYLVFPQPLRAPPVLPIVLS